jgi:hypothetical protein
LDRGSPSVLGQPDGMHVSANFQHSLPASGGCPYVMVVPHSSPAGLQPTES